MHYPFWLFKKKVEQQKKNNFIKNISDYFSSIVARNISKKKKQEKIDFELTTKNSIFNNLIA